LSDQFEFVVGYQTLGDKFPENCDLYFTYEVNQVKHIPEQFLKRAITGVTSHTYINFRDWQTDLKKVRAIHANSQLLFNEVEEFNKTY